MQAQSIATSVLPAVTGGMSTSAMLLVGFLADVDIYKYLNVDFPENFVSFCRQMGERIYFKTWILWILKMKAIIQVLRSESSNSGM